MGTRMLASLESNVHDGLKQAIIDASETDTVLVNRHNGKPMRVLRTDTTSELEFATEGDPMGDLLMNTVVTYTQGILENSLPSVGQVAGRIDSLLPVAEIMRQTVDEFGEAVRPARRAVSARGVMSAMAVDPAVTEAGEPASTWPAPLNLSAQSVDDNLVMSTLRTLARRRSLRLGVVVASVAIVASACLPPPPPGVPSRPLVVVGQLRQRQLPGRAPARRVVPRRRGLRSSPGRRRRAQPPGAVLPRRVG